MKEKIIKINIDINSVLYVIGLIAGMVLGWFIVDLFL